MERSELEEIMRLFLSVCVSVCAHFVLRRYELLRAPSSFSCEEL